MHRSICVGKSKKEIEPVLFLSFNYYELATIIRDDFLVAISNPTALGGSVIEDDIDLESLAEYLKTGLLPEALEEFSASQFGRGILMGAYLEYTLQKSKTEEAEVLNDMDEADL